jgi:hypothetical protein
MKLKPGASQVNDADRTLEFTIATGLSIHGQPQSGCPEAQQKTSNTPLRKLAAWGVDQRAKAADLAKQVQSIMIG